MKKPSDQLLERQKRLSRYSAQRRAQSHARIRARSRRAKRRGRQGKQYGVKNCPAPKLFAYHSSQVQRDIFVAFVENIEESLHSGRRTCIDFRKVERLFPCGMLLFLGWLDEWLQHYPGMLFGKYPEDDLVEQMLQSAKVLQRLGLGERKSITHNDVKRWHQFEGHNVDATPFEPFMRQVREETDTALQMGLADCIHEALANVKNHAYETAESSRWWMFATIDPDRKNILVAVHDRGDSIPGTLLRKPGFGDAVTLRKLRKGGDCELIAAALGGRTRTKLHYRGKGLPEMLDFTLANPDNGLAIYSRAGYFRGLGANKSQTKGTLKRAVSGTLLIWTLNYSGEAS